MVRVYSTNVMNIDLIQGLEPKSIKMVIVNNRRIKFVMNDKINELALLPSSFYWEIKNDGLHLLSLKKSYKNFENVFYHKLTGTYRSLILNAINGLLYGYVRKVLIVGSGYRSSYKIDTHELHIFVGYANTIIYKLKNTVNVKLEINGTEITLSSYNKQDVTQTMSQIVKIKKVNVYSGTGIHNSNKKFIRKEVKKV